MRKSIVSLCLLTGMICGVQTFAAESPAQQDKADSQTTPISTVPPAAVAQPVPAEPEYEGLDNPAACFARGLANVSTCWLELPRCAIYDNAEVPFFGLIVGIPEGTMFTVARALTGVADIISFGATGDSIYGKRYPDFVWEANWLPPKKSKK